MLKTFVGAGAGEPDAAKLNVVAVLDCIEAIVLKQLVAAGANEVGDAELGAAELGAARVNTAELDEGSW